MKFKKENLAIEINEKQVIVTAPLKTNMKAAIIHQTLTDDYYGTASKLTYEARLYVLIANYYTNIFEVFEGLNEQESIFDTYDILDTNGVFPMIISAIDEISPGEIDTFLAYAEHARNEHQELAKSPSVGILELVDRFKNSLIGSLDTDDIEELNKILLNVEDNLKNQQEKED